MSTWLYTCGAFATCLRHSHSEDTVCVQQQRKKVAVERKGGCGWQQGVCPWHRKPPDPPCCPLIRLSNCQTLRQHRNGEELSGKEEKDIFKGGQGVTNLKSRLTAEAALQSFLVKESSKSPCQVNKIWLLLGAVTELCGGHCDILPEYFQDVLCGGHTEQMGFFKLSKGHCIRIKWIETFLCC